MALFVDRERWAGPTLSLLRIVAAFLFLLHGSAKLLGFPPSPMPSPPVGSLFWIAGLFELVGGGLLLLGLFSRPVAFLLSGEMAVGYWMLHAPKSPFPMVNQGEAAILFCFVFLLIAAAGPGPWSVDDGARRRRISLDAEPADDGKVALP